MSLRVAVILVALARAALSHLARRRRPLPA
jgi:hypothetical protein